LGLKNKGKEELNPCHILSKDRLVPTKNAFKAYQNFGIVSFED